MLLLKQQLLEKLEKDLQLLLLKLEILQSRSAEAAKILKLLVENATTKANEGKNIADEMIKGYLELNKIFLQL